MSEDPEYPPLPYIPAWRDLKLFLLGALWFIIPTLGPAGLLLWHDVTKYSDPIDWSAIVTVAGSGAGLGLVAYWRKYRALISPPPGSDMKKVVATVQTIQMAPGDPSKMVTTTVQETTVKQDLPITKENQ